MAHPVMPAPTIAISNVSARCLPAQVDRPSIGLSYGLHAPSAAAMRRTAPQHPPTAGEGRHRTIGDLVCRPWCQRFVSFCNSKQKKMGFQMLQIETFPNGAAPLSQSVTARPIFAELLLQIETNRCRHPPPANPHEGAGAFALVRTLVLYVHMFYSKGACIGLKLQLRYSCKM